MGTGNGVHIRFSQLEVSLYLTVTVVSYVNKADHKIRCVIIGQNVMIIYLHQFSPCEGAVSRGSAPHIMYIHMSLCGQHFM